MYRNLFGRLRANRESISWRKGGIAHAFVPGLVTAAFYWTASDSTTVLSKEFGAIKPLFNGKADPVGGRNYALAPSEYSPHGLIASSVFPEDNDYEEPVDIAYCAGCYVDDQSDNSYNVSNACAEADRVFGTHLLDRGLASRFPGVVFKNSDTDT